MVLTPRQEKLQTLRDDMSPGSRPAAIVPRNFAEAQAMCGALARSGLVPKAYIERPENMIVTIMCGAEVGLPPMQSLRLYHILDDVPRLGAEGIRAIIMASPSCEYFEFAKSSDTEAVWIGKRPGRPEKSITWTIERAKRAGLAGKNNWQKSPEDMLNARASMQLGRLIWPEICAGMISKEEAEDGDFVQAESKETPAFVAAPVVSGGGGSGSVTLVSSGGQGGNSATAMPRPELSPATVVGSTNTGEPVRALGTEAPAKRGPGRPPKDGSPRPTSSSKADSQSATPASQTSSKPTSEPPVSASSAAETPRENPAAPIEGSATVDRWGQAIDAGPTSADSNTEHSPSAESAPTSTSETSSGVDADDPVDGGFGEEPAAPAAVVLKEFNDWVMSCKNQRDLGAGLPKWRTWSKDQHAKGDARFAKGGELTNAMQDAYSRRKGEVPA